MRSAKSLGGGTAPSDPVLRWKGSLILLAAGLQVFQIVAVFTGFHALRCSNLVQFVLPLVASACCLVRLRAAADPRRRGSWRLLGIAFAVWAAGETAHLAKIHVVSTASYPAVDDVLWLLFAIPLLLVLSGSKPGEFDVVNRLDRAQVFISFAIVELLVFSHPQLIAFDKAYDLQNTALLLTCFLRYSAEETVADRVFYGDYGIYLLVYSSFVGVGSMLAHRGWQEGGAVDLFWTVPSTAFCFIALLGGGGSFTSKRSLRSKSGLVRHVHDLCALGLAMLSVASSIYLLLHSVVPGAICLVMSFANFAARTWSREWQLNQAHDSLQEIVLGDTLTGLGNRMRLRQELAAMLNAQAEEPVAGTITLLFVDLDRFKAINDGLGHEAGDRVLVEISKRIKATIAAEALACRLGGDEFVVLLRVKEVSEAETLSAKVLSAIREPLFLETKLLQVSGSIGVVLATEEDQADDLLRQADQAMYRAKKLGKDRVQFCGGDLSSKVRLGYQLETDLRECLNRKDMGVYLQPIYSLQKMEICGFEALARWAHPQLGIVSPGDFIPIAEDSGMIVELARQILFTACQEVASWNKHWGGRLTLSVNVSARQFSNPDLLPGIFEILYRTGMDPRLVILEITESVLVVADSTVAQVLMEAQQHGLQISLDDFGTGYSSLSHLLNFPTDEIKVDCTFVQGLNTDERRAELVRTVLHLGRSLNKRVIAEGVETPEELMTLREMGCQYVQGYLFAKPFPAEHLAHQLVTNASAYFLKDMQSAYVS